MSYQFEEAIYAIITTSKDKRSRYSGHYKIDAGSSEIFSIDTYVFIDDDRIFKHEMSKLIEGYRSNQIQYIGILEIMHLREMVLKIDASETIERNKKKIIKKAYNRYCTDMDYKDYIV